MSKPIDTILTFASPSIRLPNGRKNFQGLLYNRICDHLNPLAWAHPATLVLQIVRNRVKKTRRVKIKQLTTDHGNQSKL